MEGIKSPIFEIKKCLGLGLNNNDFALKKLNLKDLICNTYAMYVLVLEMLKLLCFEHWTEKQKYFYVYHEKLFEYV